MLEPEATVPIPFLHEQPIAAAMAPCPRLTGLPIPDRRKAMSDDMMDFMDFEDEPMEEFAEDEFAEDDYEVMEAVAMDSDGDGEIDLVAADTDADGLVDVVGADTDADGELDTYVVDVDGDGAMDAVGLDEDQDGEVDVIMADLDGDGTLEAELEAGVEAEFSMEADAEFTILEDGAEEAAVAEGEGGEEFVAYPDVSPDTTVEPEIDQFEEDSAGWPGGAYQNPDSSYYDPGTYE
jgi:hypothetical protein